MVGTVLERAHDGPWRQQGKRRNDGNGVAKIEPCQIARAERRDKAQGLQRRVVPYEVRTSRLDVGVTKQVSRIDANQHQQTAV